MSGSWGALLIGTGPPDTPNTSGATVSRGPVDCPGGTCVFSVVGTFGGATVKLQVLGPDGATWIDAGVGTTLTAAGMGVVYLPPGMVQAVIVGGAPAGIFAALARIVS